MNIQAPPNLSPDALPRLIDAGINDWGGVSPITPDHVNPEAPWPHLDTLERATNAAGKQLVETTGDLSGFRPPGGYMGRPGVADLAAASHRRRWGGRARRMVARSAVPRFPSAPARTARVARMRKIAGMLARARAGDALGKSDIVRLFRCRGDEFAAVCAAADELRQDHQW
jgi:FO synthase